MGFDISEVKFVKNYILYIWLEDDLSGEVDVGSNRSFRGVFFKLKDRSYFSTVKVDSELEAVV